MDCCLESSQDCDQGLHLYKGREDNLEDGCLVITVRDWGLYLYKGWGDNLEGGCPVTTVYNSKGSRDEEFENSSWSFIFLRITRQLGWAHPIQDLFLQGKSSQICIYIVTNKFCFVSLKVCSLGRVFLWFWEQCNKGENFGKQNLLHC